MNVDVVLLPRDLEARHLDRRCVVVFDVLRATTTMTAALAAGVREIRIFGDLASATAAGGAFDGARILCGEANCLPPPGFDLGNSPGAFTRGEHGGLTAFMSTTNGTRAILAARGARSMFIGALVNASAVAGALASEGIDVTLLCAGTNGDVAMEDVLGAGAVLHALMERFPARPGCDAARMALRLFESGRRDLRSAFAESQGGRNVIDARLCADVDFASRLDVFDHVGAVRGDAPVVRTWEPR